MIPIRKKRTMRDIAAHKRDIIASWSDMPALADGLACATVLKGVSLTTVIAHCARWARPVSLTVVTWALSIGAIETIRGIKAITDITWLLDGSQNSRKPKVMAAAKASGTVHIVSSHAKLAILEGPKHSIVLDGSGNMTRSRGSEWLNICVDNDYAQAVKGLWMGEI